MTSPTTDMEITTLLMEHDIYLTSSDGRRKMHVDEMYELGGEFVVWEAFSPDTDLYRGDDFEEALKILEFGQ